MIYTVGHSTTPWSEFLELIAKMDVLVDVRSHPGSRWPQFQGEEMQRQLQDRYLWMPGLGGWRADHLHMADRFAQHGVDLNAYSGRKFPKQRIAAKVKAEDLAVREEDGEPILQLVAKPAWTNQGLYDYSWFMITPEFLDAADELIELGKAKDVAIMCCEAQAYRCHRSLVSDYLIFKGIESYNLMGRPTKTLGYRVSVKPHSAHLLNRLERYDTEIVDAWKARCLTGANIA